MLSAADDHVTAAEPSAEAIGPSPVTAEREAHDILKDIIPVLPAPLRARELLERLGEIPASAPAATTKRAQTTAGLPSPLNLEATGRAASLSGNVPRARSQRDRKSFRPTSRARPISGDKGVPPLDLHGSECEGARAGSHRRTASAPALVLSTSDAAATKQQKHLGNEALVA